MPRSSRAALAGSGGCVALLAFSPLFAPAPAAAGQVPNSGISARVTPNHGLTPGQVVSVTGRGFGKPPNKNDPAWFVTECTSTVRGHMNPSTDTSHCDISQARSVRVGRNGTFSLHFQVTTGIVGDGYCGTLGHPSCVIGIGNARGQGMVLPITFLIPSS
jgi:hypothetical protein